MNSAPAIGNLKLDGPVLNRHHSHWLIKKSPDSFSNEYGWLVLSSHRGSHPPQTFNSHPLDNSDTSIQLSRFKLVAAWILNPPEWTPFTTRHNQIRVKLHVFCFAMHIYKNVIYIFLLLTYFFNDCCVKFPVIPFYSPNISNCQRSVFHMV